MMITRSLRAARGPMGITRALVTKNPEDLPYTERMALKGRPVSPHVTIYAFPITAISSITNRFTGVGLSVGILGIASASLVGIDPSAVTNAVGNTTLIGPLAKIAVSFPLVYHYLGGLRHMAWDSYPQMLQTEGVASSSYALLAGSAAISVALAFVTI